jgi:adenine-specific DNA methylase
MTADRRLIEEWFPVKDIGIESAKEKNNRHGYISTLHTWWSRKPLAVSRATIYAALVNHVDDKDEFSKNRDFIINLSKWENSLNFDLLEIARDRIRLANLGKKPKIFDPFAGGGAIPLEALRLGCEVYCNDYNPVAVLLQKCSLEYPQKFGNIKNNTKSWGNISSKNKNNPLIDDLKRWGDWILNETRNELERFYPNEQDDFILIGYYWMWTIKCQNPNCGIDIPLTTNWLLAQWSNKKIFLVPFLDENRINFKILENTLKQPTEEFDPNNGTISEAIVTCPICKSTIDADMVKKIFQMGAAGQRIVAVISQKEGKKGKKYRVANENDAKIFALAEIELKQKIQKLSNDWGINPIPDELIHNPDGQEYKPGQLFYKYNPVVLYKMTKLGDLFNSRQKLALITFIEKIKIVRNKLIQEKYSKEYILALLSYFALAVDRLADYGSMLCMLNTTGGRGVVHTFGRQSISMTWDYMELNPFNPFAAGWQTACEKNEDWIQHASQTSGDIAIITNDSATNLSYFNNYFDAVFTDPPYYDNIPYSDLSDFFYVWLKRVIGDLEPELFSTPLTPKSNEIISDITLLRGMDKQKATVTLKDIKTEEKFEFLLKKSFNEIFRVLKNDGILILVYAHKSTVGWETLINSLLNSGLIITAAWPINTEMQGRLRAQKSATLASSIYIVARKMERQPTGFYNNVKEELKTHLNKKLERLWHEGISGADFFIAAIGSAIEVFGKYEQVMDYEGNIVRADRLLVDVRKIATDYAVRQILHNGFAGEISDLVRLYVLWRWNYGEAKVPFDEARKLGQSCGIDISHEWSHTGFVKKEKEFVRLLGPQERKLEDLEGSKDMIDVLHQVLLLWEKSRRDEMIKVLQVTGYGKSEAFYRVAQAISESLPNESKEKKLLEGFTAGRERMTEEVKKEARQARLEF